jgi:RNA polymerase sigma-70 factor, ECF subfamily
MRMSLWFTTFLAALGETRAAVVRGSLELDALQAELLNWLSAVEGTWPTIGGSRTGFVQHLARHLPGERALSEALRLVHGSDLFLAYHVLCGAEGALAAFEAYALKDVANAVRSMGDARFADEVRQAARIRLLVAEERPEPRIAEYTGHGPLAGWVRVTATRLGLQMSANQREVRAERELDALGAAAADPEVEFLRARYATALRAALKTALSQLGSEQRTVLKMHHADGLSVAEIGQILGVHKATAARWIVDAREQTTKALRSALETELGVRRSEAESLMGLVDSRFEASIASALAS